MGAWHAQVLLDPAGVTLESEGMVVINKQVRHRQSRARTRAARAPCARGLRHRLTTPPHAPVDAMHVHGLVRMASCAWPRAHALVCTPSCAWPHVHALVCTTQEYQLPIAVITFASQPHVPPMAGATALAGGYRGNPGGAYPGGYPGGGGYNPYYAAGYVPPAAAAMPRFAPPPTRYARPPPRRVKKPKPRARRR